ncbi:MAG: hypothetical protein GY749_33935 [Desulfobacteraceae bacterium]|nr:hypothetical protein [Desulfobacteraceae bacterium]
MKTFGAGNSDIKNTRSMPSWSGKIRSYTHLIITGVIAFSLIVYLLFQISDINMSVMIFLYVISLVITYIITKKELEVRHDGIVHSLKKNYNIRIRKLKREHDTATLEKTIRDGTKTLIKNAVEYFKIENIRNEMPLSAAIQNLQLDKYGQIIELLADFSLILPDYQENQEIVQEEINHQIEIYLIDEEAFAEFLQRITEKYIVTVHKKIRERQDLDVRKSLKPCPQCAEKILPNSQVCRHCGHQLKASVTDISEAKKSSSEEDEPDWVKKGYESYRSGNFKEAIRIFTVAIDLNPEDSQAYYNRGILHMKIDKQTQAADDLKSAASMGHKKARKVLNSLLMMKTHDGGGGS